MSEEGFEFETFRASRVLGRSFSVLFRNIAPAGLLALVIFSPPYVLGQLLDSPYFGTLFRDLDDDSWTLQGVLGTALHALLVGCLEAVLAFGVYGSLQGRRPGAWELVRGGLTRLPPALAVVVVVVVLVNLPFLLPEPSFEVSWVGWLLPPAVLVCVFASIFLFVAIPAAALEGLGVRRSLARSCALVRGSVLRLIGLFLMMLITVVAPSVLLVFLLAHAGFAPAAVPYHILVWPDLLLTAFLYAFFAVVATVTYHDLRVAREGPDTSRLAAVFD